MGGKQHEDGAGLVESSPRSWLTQDSASEEPRLIREILKKGKTVFSVEFFPPKDEAMRVQLHRAACTLPGKVAFVSITYGAGGSTRELTLDYAQVLSLYGFTVMPHLTCVGHSQAQLIELVEQFQAAGFRNLMVLRGDPPRGETAFTPYPDGLHYASELVALIRKHFSDFCLGVAGYPEKHPEAPTEEADLEHLRRKVDQGASFITTQLFFDNAPYFRFVQRCRSIGITIPILAGILPVLSYKQVTRFCRLCGAILPAALEKRLVAAGEDAAAVCQIGVEWTYAQIKELVQHGVPGIHFYSLNRSESVLKLMQWLRSDGLL